MGEKIEFEAEAAYYSMGDILTIPVPESLVRFGQLFKVTLEPIEAVEPSSDADIARAEATRLAEQVEELWAEVRGLLKMVKGAEGE